MELDISHMWLVLLSSPQGENYVCHVLVMLLGFCLGFLTYALLRVCIEEDRIKAGALHLDRKVARFLMACSSRGISAIVPGSTPQTTFTAPLTFTSLWKIPLSLMTAEHSSVLKLPSWVQRYYPGTASPATVQGQSCESSTFSSPRMTIPCALFAGLALHPVTCVERQVKRWPNFCKVAYGEIPREG